MPPRPTRPQVPRRTSGRPLDVAASLVLTVGLLGSSAPAALAADAAPAAQPQAAPSAPESPSAPVPVNPALERTVTATFKPQPPNDDGSDPLVRVEYTAHLKNTGDAPLNVFIDAFSQPNDAPITLAVGESKDLGPDGEYFLQSELASGFWRLTTMGSAYTPQGVRIDASIDASVPVPGGSPASVPSQPAKPTDGPSQPPTPTPGPSQAGAPITPSPGTSTTPATGIPAVTVTITGKLDTKPGELVKEGTRVQFTYDVKNTGGVDLTDVLGRKKLAVGESFLLTTTEAVVTAQNLKDEFVAAQSKLVRGTLPDGKRVTVSAPFEYKLPIPDKPPISAEAPDLDVTVSGTFEVKEGEPVIAGTKVKWIAELTNTGNVALRDVQVADSGTLDELPVGETGVVSFETSVTERDVFNHSIFVAAPATALTPAGIEYSKQTLGTLAIPAAAPAPVAPAPASVGPGAQQAAAPSAGAAARSAAEVATSAAPAAPSSTRSTAGRLASTGSDAAAVLPAAGVLTLLGALGVLLGRRRRGRTVTD